MKAARKPKASLPLRSGMSSAKVGKPGRVTLALMLCNGILGRTKLG